MEENNYLKTRPAGPPKVWKVIEGVKNDGSGEPLKITLQEIPEDRGEEVIDHMCTYFLADEPTCKSLKAKDDPLFVEDFRNIWKVLLKQGISVVAFVDDPQGGKPIIAGVNMLLVDTKDHVVHLDGMLQSTKAKHIMEVILGLTNEARVYEKYNVDKCMFALGLSVHPSYRGQALGAHILKVRENIGREYKIPITSTAFTSPISQKLAARVGFEEILTKDYVDIKDSEGKPAFPGIEAKTFKIMGKRLY